MDHPNAVRTREIFAAAAAGDFEPMIACLADDIVNVNDVGAGPWRENHGKQAVLDFYFAFMTLFEGTFRQDVLDVHGFDDRVVMIVHETGTAQGQTYDNRAVYLLDVDGNGRYSSLRTVDMDYEGIERFWASIALPDPAVTAS